MNLLPNKNGACGEEELRHYFRLNGRTTGKTYIPKEKLQTRPMELFMCSVKQKEGYGEAFRWLSNYL
ncbi:unnamed protein product [Brachionus calyciflorus]|uniref:small monomeric GTPase n=1 Tax=Brachionus calyciflorus TaxID=104777 RepID=A0A813MCX2_9BILA|nr:unnamed protein product [Brachionus calyciflorus]